MHTMPPLRSQWHINAEHVIVNWLDYHSEVVGFISLLTNQHSHLKLEAFIQAAVPVIFPEEISFSKPSKTSRD